MCFVPPKKISLGNPAQTSSIFNFLSVADPASEIRPGVWFQ